MTLPNELATLRAARIALEPSDADRKRILGTTLEAAAGGAAPRYFVEKAGAVASAASGPALLRRAAPYVAGAFLLGGIGGFYAGFSAGQRRVEATPVLVAPVATWANDGARSAAPDETPAVEAEAPAAVTPTPAPAQNSRPLAPARASTPARASAAATIALSPERSLEEELRALRRTERALRDHNPRLARALLAELDRLVPQGKLHEERAAVAAVAACQLDPSPAPAQQFAAKFASSVHLERVRQACSSGAAQETTAPVDSSNGL
jgi:hypothetical protein